MPPFQTTQLGNHVLHTLSKRYDDSDSDHSRRVVVAAIIIAIIILKLVILLLLWRRYQRRKELRESERRRALEQIGLNEYSRDRQRYGKIEEQIDLNEQARDRGRYSYYDYTPPARTMPAETKHTSLAPPPYMPRVPERAASPDVLSPKHV
ncbi:hypothetical protein K491DRAFT_693196 [Lophiostoma macrostomum CBS 122681]|uniref:Uncharacterized protein n=1 Tax=Lophiostoma macrostomum CBS 122681 TaxID=1314788 RepID=A0A6A6T5K9_9PLEO|nr:hypothetical protein K491DRAFT_693196 [Lophiostoma macrostomum CBS 122681]